MNLILLDRCEASCWLSGADQRTRHIRTVLRSSVGDTLKVGVVDGPVGEAVVTAVDKTGVSLSVQWDSEGPPASLPSVTLLLGHPRPPVLKRLWRDLASIGIEEIRVYAGDLGERSYLTSSAWNDPCRWLSDGLSQGGHTRMPRLHRYATLTQAVNDAQPLRFFGALHGSTALSLREMTEMIPGAGAVQLCVGPERGLTAREDRFLREHRFLPVQLGPGIMRTEVAALAMAVAAVSALSERY